MANFISEDDIEQATLQRLKDDYGYQLLNCYTVDAETLNDRSHRTNKQEVILRDRLKAAALRINPHIPETAIDEAIAIVTQPRLALSTIAANIEIDGLLRNGISVSYTDDKGCTEEDRVRLIDFDDPSPTGNNEFLAVSQLWITKQDGVTSTANYRRPDILLYINGIPLVFIELKNSNVNVKDAFDKNLTDYKRDIPQLFHPNALCILSNALETRVGSFTSTWDYFFP